MKRAIFHAHAGTPDDLRKYDGQQVTAEPGNKGIYFAVFSDGENGLVDEKELEFIDEVSKEAKADPDLLDEYVRLRTESILRDANSSSSIEDEISLLVRRLLDAESITQEQMKEEIEQLRQESDDNSDTDEEENDEDE